jgi:hypothetical protein
MGCADMGRELEELSLSWIETASLVGHAAIRSFMPDNPIRRYLEMRQKDAVPENDNDTPRSCSMITTPR